MTVSDGAGRSASESMTVTVQRNRNVPRFTDVNNNAFTVNVDNNIPIGTTVYDAESTDGDSNTNTVVSC